MQGWHLTSWWMEPCLPWMTSLCIKGTYIMIFWFAGFLGLTDLKLNKINSQYKDFIRKNRDKTWNKHNTSWRLSIRGKRMTKIGIIRHQETVTTLIHKRCAGWNSYPAIQNKSGYLNEYDTIELVGFDTCGGCPKGNSEGTWWGTLHALSWERWFSSRKPII